MVNTLFSMKKFIKLYEELSIKRNYGGFPTYGEVALLLAI